MKQLFYTVFCYLLFVSIVFAQEMEEDTSENILNFTPQEVQPLSDVMTSFNDIPRGDRGLRIMFYNVENLFDTENDSIKRDDDFTPTGMKGWSGRRYKNKLKNIYRVIMGVGGWEPPACVGLCEVENRFVVNEMVARTPLRDFNYKIVHEESPDKRGIDVAFLYRPDKFQYISHEALNITFPFDTESRTRDILYIKGRALKKDTLHIFVNHWPSRFGGHLETDPKREYVASVLRKKVDAIYAENSQANIIIMGDLNDAPQDESVSKVLNAKLNLDEVREKDLYNLMSENLDNWKAGTHKHGEHWGILDQIIISPLLLNRQTGLQLSKDRVQIFGAGFLIEKEDLRLGLRPFRTYIGARYHDGYSDHLPVFIDVIYVNSPEDLQLSDE